MTGKIGLSAHDDNGAPIKGTHHKRESIDHPGTNGERVNGASNGHPANGH